MAADTGTPEPSAGDLLLASVPEENREPLKSALHFNMVDRGTMARETETIYSKHQRDFTLSSGMYCQDVAECMGRHALACALHMLKECLNHGVEDPKLIYQYANHEFQRYLRAEVPATLRDPRLVNRVSDNMICSSVEAALTKGADLRHYVETETYKFKQQRAKEKAQVSTPNFNMSGNNQVHIGDGGTQSIVTYQQVLQSLEQEIQKSSMPDEQKKSALKTLKEFMSLPGISQLIGAGASAAIEASKHVIGG
jgi:hypothetical protein